MKHILTFLKGVLFGASNLIPGMSGGTMLVITKIYDKLLDSIANILKKFKAVIIFLLIFAVGAIIGILGGGIFLKRVMLEYIPLPTYCFFAGIILGSVPMLAKPVIKKINWKYVISFILGALAVIGLMFLGLTFNKDSSVPIGDVTLEFKDYALLFVSGFIGCFAMLIPGVSGVLMLVVFNYYGTFMDAIAHITKFSMAGYHNVILVLLPFGLGIIAGLIPASKLLSWMFKRFPIGSYFAILGFVLASIPVIFVNFFQEYGSNPSTTATLQIILGFISLRIGFVLSYFLSKLKMNNKEDNEIDGNTIVVEEKEIQQEQVEEIEENKPNIIKDEQP
jgi:putative membrane protein